jgi:hypothetical protein
LCADFGGDRCVRRLSSCPSHRLMLAPNPRAAKGNCRFPFAAAGSAARDITGLVPSVPIFH